MWWLALVSVALGGPIDVNTASVSDLDGLPGLGRAKAAAIIAHREANGPFTSLDGLLVVSGIGPGTLAAVRPHLVVGAQVLAAGTRARLDGEAPLLVVPSASTVNPNTASVGELSTLPGISLSRAAAIVEDRARNGPFESCAELVRIEGIGPATVEKLVGLCRVPAKPTPTP